MWRRHGDSLYALLVVVVFTLELGALAAEESALALRDLLRGDDGLALTELLQGYSLDERLINRMRGRRLAPRLDALDQLSRARFRTAFEPLVQAFVESDAVARLMAG